MQEQQTAGTGDAPEPGSILLIFPPEGGFQSQFKGPIKPSEAVNALELVKTTLLGQQIAQLTQPQGRQSGIVAPPPGMQVPRNRMG